MLQFIISVMTLVTAGLVAYQTWRSNRTQNTKLTSQDDQLKQIHVLVNKRFSDVVERVSQLRSALEDADVDVPPEADAGGGPPH